MKRIARDAERLDRDVETGASTKDGLLQRAQLDSSLRWNDERKQKNWIPAGAGITGKEELDSRLRGNDEQRRT